MPARDEGCQLGIVAAIARTLPSASTPEAAAEAVVGALTTLGVGCALMAIDGDVGRTLAIGVDPAVDGRLTSPVAQRLLDLSFPVAGVALLRETLRRRAPYVGTAGAMATMRGMPDVRRRFGVELSQLQDAEVVAVPVEAFELVVAVVVVWGPGCDAGVVPLLEAVAGMLSVCWRWGRSEPGAIALARPQPQRRRAGAQRAVARLVAEDRLRAALQPIVRLHDGTVMGWEALCRFSPVPGIATPDELFAAAGAALEEEVDAACLRAAVREAAVIDSAPLFLNVGMRTILADGSARRLCEILDAGRMEPGRVVVELSEREPVLDLRRLQRTAVELRGTGIRLAVDDAGAGHASMRLIAELRPDFIKIDRSLIHEVATDSARRALVVALLSFGGHIGSRVIAEGVETADEKLALSDLGVQYGQGWHLGMPVLVAPPPGARAAVAVDPGWFAEQRVLGFAEPLPGEAPAPGAPLRTSPAPRRRQSRRSLPQALSEAVGALQSEHDSQRIISAIAEQLNGVIPVDEIAIYAADLETHRFVPLYASGPDAQEILADGFGLDAGLTGWAFAQGVPQKVDDTSTHPMARQIPGTPVTEESVLLVPMIAGDRRIGMINCYRSGAGRFGETELKAASLFAHIAAAAWRNAELYSELRDAAMTDSLTSLLNTRWLHEAGERELARSIRAESDFSLLLLDLDHFKQVNDSCGHAAGDALLRRVAHTLRTTIRRSDAAVRFGGEEFVLLLPDTGVDGALRLAEKVREAVRSLRVPAECTLRTLTTSIGVSALGVHGERLDSLIRAADVALYEAKRGGRDRVVIAVAARGAASLRVAG